MVQQFKRWIGIAPAQKQIMKNKPVEVFKSARALAQDGTFPEAVDEAIDHSPDKDRQRELDIESVIGTMHFVLDNVYGTGFSRDNPAIVAQFMQAASIRDLAASMGALAETLASGSGALTIGIDKS